MRHEWKAERRARIGAWAAAASLAVAAQAAAQVTVEEGRFRSTETRSSIDVVIRNDGAETADAGVACAFSGPGGLRQVVIEGAPALAAGTFAVATVRSAGVFETARCEGLDALDLSRFEAAETQAIETSRQDTFDAIFGQ